MKQIKLLLALLCCSCQPTQTDSESVQNKPSPISNQQVKDLEISSHQNGYVQWNLKAKEVHSDLLQKRQLKDVTWTAPTQSIKLTMKEAKQVEKRIFTSQQGNFSTDTFNLLAFQLQLNLNDNQLIGQSAKLSHFQGEIEFNNFQIELESQKLRANKVHAIIKRSYP